MKFNIRYMLLPVLSGLIFLASCSKTPEACFTQSKLEARSGEEIVFTDCSTNGGSKFRLDMGDGNIIDYYDASFPITYSYRNPGIYYIIYDLENDNETKTDRAILSVTISPIEIEDFLGEWDLWKIEEISASGNSIQTSDPDQIYDFSRTQLSIATSWSTFYYDWDLFSNQGEISIRALGSFSSTRYTIQNINSTEMVLSTGSFSRTVYHFRKL